ncbi:hypothetical protein FF38_13351 [Lucilia cuprina]|uniref:Uncharacterized protein n=1 Tax=Lucilia cuprina TaxID=7375 RepID=A0A0L0BTM7_LUCCU|nr:hypothetical protein FF38_13351 [Lucilia cuprina]
MDIKLKIWLNFLLIMLHQSLIVQGTLYVYLIEDPAIFQDCKNEPDYLGVADMFDLSNLSIELLDETVHMEGSFTMVWDADPDDRVELHTDLMKYERGSWQPTVFTMIQKDFCATLFDENDIWYKTWAQFIDSDDLKCITNKGHTYHHVPFDLEAVADIQGEDISGRHKLVLKVDAFNRQDEKQPYSVCLEIEGDIMKK